MVSILSILSILSGVGFVCGLCGAPVIDYWSLPVLHYLARFIIFISAFYRCMSIVETIT